jgi:molecular chaperone GrpE
MLTTHEIEDILDRFRSWLQETNEDLDQLDIIALAEQLLERGSTNGASTAEASASVGLLQVAETFTALRHEIKLQTKGLRGLQEHLGTNQQALAGAIDEFHNQRQDSAKIAEESAMTAARPLIMGLLDIDEAIGQAVKTAEAAHERSSHSQQSLIDDLDREFRQLPPWKRVWLKGFWQRVRTTLEAGPASGLSNQVEILEGLRLLQSRVRRTLTEAEVEPMQTIGQRVEPRTMRVVEVIDDPTRPPETVVDEIRAGYQWKGITLRPAEVRATKSKAT